MLAHQPTSKSQIDTQWDRFVYKSDFAQHLVNKQTVKMTQHLSYIQ